MKRLCLAILFGCFTLTSLYSQEEQREQGGPPPFQDGYRLILDGYFAGSNKLRSNQVEGQKLHYKDIGAKIAYKGNPFNDSDQHFFSIGTEYTNLNWKENPHISQSSFADLGVAAGVSTEMSTDWTLRMLATAAIDLHRPSLTKSTRYAAFAWGMFHYDPELTFHLGAMAYSDIKRYGMLPILGISYTNLYDGWKVKAIMPIKASISYKIAPEWIIALKHRYKNFRHRAKAVNSGDRRIFDYRSHGGELALKYEPNEFSQLSVSLGAHGNVEYRVFNKDGRNRQVYKTKAGLYYGFNGYVIF